VIVLDCRAFGGQAGASARIENYLGFPTGISGMALMARAYNQAQKFGVEMAIPDRANRLRNGADRNGTRYVLSVGDDETVQARTVGRGERGAISSSRYGEPHAVRRIVRALLGLADRGAALQRSGSGAGRRGQFRRTGDRVSREPRQKGVAAGARRKS